MRCATAREQLFGAERPGQPSQALATHLEGCRDCRALQWRLERLERDLPRLRVPPCPPPAALLERVLHGPEGALVRVPARAWHRPDRRQGGRQKLALAFALAASLAVFAVGWGMWSGQPASQPPVTVRGQYEVQVAQKLQGAARPGQRVARLTDLADEWLDEAQGADAAKLERLAQQFAWLKDDLPKMAEKVPAAERGDVLLEAAKRLERLNSKAAWMEAARREEPAVAESLHQITTSVGDASSRLRRLTEA
jgi:hypothetical protein